MKSPFVVLTNDVVFISGVVVAALVIGIAVVESACDAFKDSVVDEVFVGVAVVIDAVVVEGNAKEENVAVVVSVNVLVSGGAVEVAAVVGSAVVVDVPVVGSVVSAAVDVRAGGVSIVVVRVVVGCGAAVVVVDALVAVVVVSSVLFTAEI